MNATSNTKTHKATGMQSRVRTALKDRAVQRKLLRIVSNVLTVAAVILLIGGFVIATLTFQRDMITAFRSILGVVAGGVLLLIAYAFIPFEDKWEDACDYVG